MNNRAKDLSKIAAQLIKLARKFLTELHTEPACSAHAKITSALRRTNY